MKLIPIALALAAAFVPALALAPRAERLAQSRPASAEIASARAALEKLATGMKDLQVLRADYEQSQASLLTVKPLLSRGRLWLRREPACLLLEVSEPRAAVIRSDARSHQVYHPHKRQAERWLFENNELSSALFKCFTADLAAIEQAFEIAGCVQAGEDSVVRLVPRRKEIEAYLSRLELSIRDKDGVLVGIAHANAEGEQTRLSLSAIEINPKLEDPRAVFDAPLPPDVKLTVSRVPAREKR